VSSHPRLAALTARAAGAKLPMAFVYPVDAGSLQAVADAEAGGIVTPFVVGPRARMEAMAREHHLATGQWQWIDTEDVPRASADAAVALAREGRVRALAKGSLHSDDLLRAVIAKNSGMHTDSRLSHAFWFDCPRYDKPLIVADAVVNVAPNIVKKKAIIANAVAFAQAIGLAHPKVAILSAVETPTPAIPTTIEAATLIDWAKTYVPAAQIDGPFAFDNAISLHAAQIKGIVSPVAGQADILIVPNLEAGNILYKSLVYMGGAECAGLVLGARVPIVLTSRADSPAARVASCALAAIVAADERARTEA
jgi:phosphate acetyltransferase